jgi:REP element-mobilizing transposase RayT
MSTHTEILYQIIFSTKNRDTTLSKDKRKELYAYIWGILKNKKCHLYYMGGVEDHIHIITHLHPQVALADLVKDIKLSSSKYIDEMKLFKRFTGWQTGYAAFTYTSSAKEQLVDYVKNQENHHRTKSFKEELTELLKQHGIKYDEKHLF